MTNEEKLIRDIKTLRTSIYNDYKDLATLDLTDTDRKEIRDNIQFCIENLKDLHGRLER